ncbi:MAG TPA: NIPSNAP family protein [Puia sp.]|nr:NIPSNAP family protein [Puia sp.]
MKNIFIIILLSISLPSTMLAAGPGREFYSIRVYQLKDSSQESRLDAYLQTALLPALHRLGITAIGVFKAITNDTAAVKKVYLLIPFKSLEEYTNLQASLDKDAAYNTAGAAYIEATYDNPPYLRMESILLQAFPDMPHHAAPKTLQGPKALRIYELRSYEGPTERYFASKVQMFNAGGEIPLFARLGFNAVFYASVLAGSHMPNLMYMTSFDNMASRDQHWKDFGSDPFWKQLVAEPQYQHNVSHVDIVFLHPADYSEL